MNVRVKHVSLKLGFRLEPTSIKFEACRSIRLREMDANPRVDLKLTKFTEHDVRVKVTVGFFWDVQGLNVLKV